MSPARRTLCRTCGVALSAAVDGTTPFEDAALAVILREPREYEVWTGAVSESLTRARTASEDA